MVMLEKVLVVFSLHLSFVGFRIYKNLGVYGSAKAFPQIRFCSFFGLL